MENSEDNTAESQELVAPRSYRTVHRLAWVYGVAAAAFGALFSGALLPASSWPRAHGIAHELIVGGLGGIVLTTLLLALTTLLGTTALAAARFRHANASDEARLAARRRWSLIDPGFAARQVQAIVVPIGTVLIFVLLRLLWPAKAPLHVEATGNVAAAFVFALAFVSLIAERVMKEFPAPQLPEAPALRRLLLLGTITLLAAACAEIGRGVNVTWVRWPEMVLICIPAVVALELTLRALARLFLPRPNAEESHAVADSIVVALLTGGPRAPGTLLRTHLGLDFARSWALSFLSAATLPAIFATGLLCWGLSGLKLINLDHRGVYERFGAPVAVLGPGLHLLLPWPFGRLRPVEYGTIHSVAIGVAKAEPDSVGGKISAEAVPPPSMNRLWETAHSGQAHYLVPSAGTGAQSFQSVSTEISVLYRVGLTDKAALNSVYSVEDPESLIRDIAGRLVLRYFNSRTLEQVIGAERENVAASLRDKLVAALNARNAGIDVVSVLIEEIHPPTGAASAYHAVQAAEINADATVFAEQGRAERTTGIAAQEAHQLTTSASAQAIETTDAAASQAYHVNADRTAYARGGCAFLLERYYGNLKTALSRVPLTIIDNRLGSTQGPIIDLRQNPSTTSSGSATGSRSNAPPPPLESAVIGNEQ